MTTPLIDRAVASSEDREAWLRARRAGVTATEVAKLAHGGAARAALLTEKRTGVQPFNGNQYTEHGKTREPILAAWVAERFSIQPNAILFHADGNPRHLATPDGFDDDDMSGLVLSEIKTGKNPLLPIPRDYQVQMWWQQYVCGASRTLFVAEQHDDVWPDPQPLYPEPQYEWFDRNDDEIAKLVTIADDFLAELYADDFADPVFDLELDELAQLVLRDREAEARATAAKKDHWTTLQGRIATRGDWTQASAVARITQSAKDVDVEVVDEAAARAAGPDVAVRYDKALAEWNALLAEHTTKTQEKKTTLTVTAIGAKNA
jgi:hypothetical protein